MKINIELTQTELKSLITKALNITQEIGDIFICEDKLPIPDDTSKKNEMKIFSINKNVKDDYYSYCLYQEFIDDIKFCLKIGKKITAIQIYKSRVKSADLARCKLQVEKIAEEIGIKP